MARKSNYHRSFIILKPKSRGFEFVPNKAPTGYCKFEIRRGVGRAYIYMQDIKPSSSLDGNYEAYRYLSMILSGLANWLVYIRMSRVDAST